MNPSTLLSLADAVALAAQALAGAVEDAERLLAEATKGRDADLIVRVVDALVKLRVAFDYAREALDPLAAEVAQARRDRDAAEGDQGIPFGKEQPS